MDKYNITGMSCAACSARVEKAVSGVDGVTSCSVNLLTNTMLVEGTAPENIIIAAVTDAGYGASKAGAKKVQNEDISDNSELKSMKNRLIYSVLFLIILMYFSMGHMMFGFEYPSVFKDNVIAIGIAQLILSGIIMVINQKFFISAYKSIKHQSPNMDVLVSMGSMASFLYSVYLLFVFSGTKENLPMHKAHEFYFESAAMILTLITIGKALEAYSKGKTTNAIKSLMELTPKTATVIRDGKEIIIPSEDVVDGDVFLVLPGKSIPADGVVVEGNSAVNESALTGESIPADKSEGDKVYAATINQSGFLKCRATGVGSDTALSRIIQMVSDASATKAPIAKIADKVSGVFVPIIILLSIITVTVWLLCGESFGFALTKGICVLVISCPCALGLATPVAIMVGNGVGAKNGILFKTSAALEHMGRVKTVALDKTGTITKGEPAVTAVIANDEKELLRIACSLECKSEHPLAKAILKKCNEEKIETEEVSGFIALSGSGVRAMLDGEEVIGGNKLFISQNVALSESDIVNIEKLSSNGNTPLIFAKGGKSLGIIAVADEIKEDSRDAIEELKRIGITPVMITGDNKNTAEAVAKKAGIETVISDVLPDKKAEAVLHLKEKGFVAMVGDGINDAPALTSADIGVAIGRGCDIAIDSADVVLAGSSLTELVTAVRLSRATLRNIRENLFWAFCYNVIGIPLAAGLWIPLTGWELSPMFGAAAMSLSSFCVVMNALRLNLFKINYKKEKKEMEVVLKIEGMMCPHCEARVKNVLEAADGVTEALVSHEKGEATVKASKEISVDALKESIEAQGYKVIG